MMVMNRKNAKKRNGGRTCEKRGVGLGAQLGFFCQSAESVVSTVTMSSTPRATPPLKSPALKRGVTALEMMTEDVASVSVPSRP